VRLSVPVILIALLTILRPLAGAGEGTAEERLFEANRAYRDGRFQDAMQGYESLASEGRAGGHVFYNLGNAYFRLGRLGKAILNYERARLLIPRDADLDFNLGQARARVVDMAPESGTFVDSAFFWVDSLSLREAFLGFAVLNVIFWGLLLIRLSVRSEWSYYAVLLVLVFWLLAGISFGLKWYRVSWDHRAVVLEREVPVRAGPDKGDTVLFNLHEGTVVVRERNEGSWSLISLGDQRRGWLPTRSVEGIKGGY